MRRTDTAGAMTRSGCRGRDGSGRRDGWLDTRLGLLDDLKARGFERGVCSVVVAKARHKAPDDHRRVEQYGLLLERTVERGRE